MASLTREETKHIAKLAKLDFSEEEIRNFSEQLSSILDFVQKLERVETSGAQPLFNVTGIKNVFREDKVTASLTQEEALRNAPSTHNGFFKVKAIFEE